MLDRAARTRLRTLSKGNADHVAKHLVMAGRLIDVDPEAAYDHSLEAMRSAGRVDIVREAVALTAYATGRYAEALREVRTVRRLSGVDAHPAIEADCERGLGRPERALAVVAEAKTRELPLAEAVEVTIVESGARADLGELDAALLVVERLLPSVPAGEPRVRLLLVQADHLEALGRQDDAAAARRAALELSRAAVPDTIFVTDLAPSPDEAADQDDGRPVRTESSTRAPAERAAAPDGVSGEEPVAAAADVDTVADVDTDTGADTATETDRDADTEAEADADTDPDLDPASDASAGREDQETEK